MPNDNGDITAALLTASTHFPGRAEDIKKLMAHNDEFFEMCDELAVAEGALANIATVPVDERNARTEECKVWIERLTAEIAEALERGNVIPMRSYGRLK